MVVAGGGGGGVWGWLVVFGGGWWWLVGGGVGWWSAVVLVVFGDGAWWCVVDGGDYGSKEDPTMCVITPVHWKGVALQRQRSSRTLKTLSNLRAFMVCFLQLRDFCT